MATINSGIEWTGATRNLTTGCTRVMHHALVDLLSLLDLSALHDLTDLMRMANITGHRHETGT